MYLEPVFVFYLAIGGTSVEKQTVLSTSRILRMAALQPTTFRQAGMDKLAALYILK
ncbi:hypothetical protein DPMN_070320 [Dreissena polymorpha]|uniref:Uncharacterized protein n=1 Tax=Dreissena polymorpha TaxID=45954 RepID=A0A9D4BV12_DREPO|nr:hypothetical protein DPMN_070320 [Dreissena polymorpha]